MKQIIAIFAAIALTAGIALAGSAATAGTTIIHSKSGVIYTTTSHSAKNYSRGVSRNHVARHHQKRFNNRFVRKSSRNRNFRADRHRSHRFNNRHHFKRGFGGGFRRH